MTHRSITVLRMIWLGLAQVIALAAIAITVSYSLLMILRADENLPVLIVDQSQTKLLTPVVPFRGTVSYTFDAVRAVSCPGYVVTSLISKTNHGPPAVVTFRRPVNSTEMRTYDDAKSSIILPESVFPGRWELRSSVDSRCPTYERTDPTVNFEFEVTAP